VTDLRTTWLGLDLRTPIVASSSPMMQDLGKLKALEDAGAAAVVLHSLFEEQITLESKDLDHHLWDGADSYAEAASYFPELSDYGIGPERYLEHVAAARAALDIPVIASLNGVSSGGWIDYARRIEEAGASALELNVYFIPTDPDVVGSEVEAMYVELARDVCATVDIPVAIKLNPYVSSMANMARQLTEAGAKGLVMFNRFYEPDLDLERLEVVPRIQLSSSQELLLRLHWTAILHGRVPVDLGITGGVHTAEDVVKSMMVGARVAMMTSALLRHGAGYIKTVEADLVRWLEEHEYPSIELMQGSMSYLSVAEPAAFERANYMRVLKSWPQG
jgi:dihydroorotate dehydrogenase (fumarate)